MSYLINRDSPKDIGGLAKMEAEGAYHYDMASDSWERWEYGDAMKWGQGPFMDYDDISEKEAKLVMYKLRVAYFLTKHFDNSYLNGRNFAKVIESEKLIKEMYIEGETHESCAIKIGLSCD